MQALTVDDVAVFIDDEIKKQLPALDAEEWGGLRDDVLEDGRFRDPLVLWDQGLDKQGVRQGVLLDGHHRWSIWSTLPDDTPVPPPSVVFMTFDGRNEALQWCIRNQLNRRNLSLVDRRHLRSALYNAKKQSKQEAGKKGGEASGKSRRGEATAKSAVASTAAQEVAEETGVSPRTVESDNAWVNGIQAIEQVDREAATLIRSGSLNVPKQAVIDAGHLADPQELKDTIAQWKGVKPKPAPKRDAEPETKPAAPSKPDAVKVENLADDWIRRYGSPSVRALEAIAQALGREGPMYKKACVAQNDVLSAVKEMRKGKP